MKRLEEVVDGVAVTERDPNVKTSATGATPTPRALWNSTAVANTQENRLHSGRYFIAKDGP